MARYALIQGGVEVKQRDFDGDPPTLAPNKGAWLPVVTVDNTSGISLETHHRVTTRTVEPTRALVTVTAVVHPLDRLVALVKAEANRRILARYPQYKQANMTARAVKLSDIRHSRPLTSDETAEKAAIEAAWDWVTSVRATSNSIEAEITAGAVPDIANHTGWPA